MYIVETNGLFRGWLKATEDAEFNNLENALDYIEMQEKPENYRVIKIVAEYEVETKLVINE